MEATDLSERILRSDPSGSRCAASHKLANNLVMSFNSSASGIPTVRRLNVESSFYERINVGVGGRDGIARRVKEERVSTNGSIDAVAARKHWRAKGALLHARCVARSSSFTHVEYEDRPAFEASLCHALVILEPVRSRTSR
jgi:hypothetical protein